MLSIIHFENHTDDNRFCQEYMEDHGQYTHTRRRKLDNKSVQYPLVVLESNTWAIYTRQKEKIR